METSHEEDSQIPSQWHVLAWRSVSSDWQLLDPSADEPSVCIFGIVRSIAVGVVADTDLTCKLIKDSNRVAS